jgi:hypothetical protein
MDARPTNLKPKRRWRIVLYAALFLVFLGPILNWFAFALVAVSVGGSAHRGAVRDGHYFLYYKDRHTEVTEAFFQRMHAYETFTYGYCQTAAVTLIALGAVSALAGWMLRRSQRRLLPSSRG